MSSELQTTRGRVFFWLGLAVFPLFWVGWMRVRDFTPRQILAGRLWAGAYTLLLLAAWFAVPEARSRVSDLQWLYSHVALQVGIALLIWLLFRMVSIGQRRKPLGERRISIGRTLLWVFVFNFVVAIILAQIPSIFEELTPHPASLLFVIVPAVAHLFVKADRQLSDRPSL